MRLKSCINHIKIIGSWEFWENVNIQKTRHLKNAPHPQNNANNNSNNDDNDDNEIHNYKDNFKKKAGSTCSQRGDTRNAYSHRNC